MCEGLENMRKLVYAFYDQGFSFRKLTNKYPDLAGDITDCLSGDVNKDFSRLYAAVAETAEVPAPLPYGAPLRGAKRRAAGMSYEFQVTRRVEFFETDLAGIMHFSNFFRFMESAEHAFFRSLGFSVARSRNGLEVCLPRVHAECDYAAPLRFEDEVLVRLLVERKGRRSLTYQFRFSRLNGSGPQEVARGRLTVASVERQADGGMKAMPLAQGHCG